MQGRWLISQDFLFISIMNSRSEPPKDAKMSIHFLSFHLMFFLPVDFSEVLDFLAKSEMRFAGSTSHPHQCLNNSMETGLKLVSLSGISICFWGLGSDRANWVRDETVFSYFYSAYSKGEYWKSECETRSYWTTRRLTDSNIPKRDIISSFFNQKQIRNPKKD